MQSLAVKYAFPHVYTYTHRYNYIHTCTLDVQTWEHACQAKDTYQESEHSSMQEAYGVPNPTVRLVQAHASYVCTCQHKIFLKHNKSKHLYKYGSDIL